MIITRLNLHLITKQNKSSIDNMVRSEQLVKASEAENNAILFKPGDSVYNDNFSPDEGNEY